MRKFFQAIARKLGIGLDEYVRDLENCKRGKRFPYWKYARSEWPAPYWQLVTKEDALGHCPNCGSAQQLGSRDIFPRTYACGQCGFKGSHPLYIEARA